MDNNTNKHSNNMNIFFNSFITDKWTINGLLGCVFTFFSQFLTSLAFVNQLITTFSAICGLGVAGLSLYKSYKQMQREDWEFKQKIKDSKKK